MTVHVPRRPYVEALPGIPTIRVFEALACGIPLVSRAVGRREDLFTPGRDFLVARDGARDAAPPATTCSHDDALARELARHGLRDDPARATPARTASTSCSAILRELDAAAAAPHAAEHHAKHRCMTPHWTSRSSARAWSRRTGTARRPTTAASSARCTSAATASPSTSPTPTTASSIATSPIRDWAEVVVYPGEGDGGALRDGRARARRRSGRQGERRRRVRRAARSARCSTLQRPDDAASSSGTSTRRRRSTACATIRHDPFRALIPRYDLVLTYGGGEPVVDAYERFGARALRADLQRARSATRIIRSPPDPRFAADLGFLGNRCPTARRASRSSSSTPRRRCPDSTFLLGGNGWGDKAMPRQRATTSATSTRRPQRLQLHAARGAERQPREHGALRLLAGDARVRGGRRGGVPDHRRVGRHRAVPRARTARSWSRTTARRSPRIVEALDARARARDRRARRIGACSPSTPTRTARRAQCRRARAATASRTARMRRATSARERLDAIVILGLSITSSWGNGHATTYRGAGARAARRGHDVLFLERDVPWYARAPRPAAPAVRGAPSLYDEPRASCARALRRRDRERRSRHRRLLRARRRRGRRRGCTATARGIDRVLRHRHAGDARRSWRAASASTSTRAMIPRYDLYLSFTGGPTLRRLERRVRLAGARARCIARSIPSSTTPRRDAAASGTSATSAPTATTASRRSSACCSTPARALARRALRSSPGRSIPTTSPGRRTSTRIEHLPPARAPRVLQRAALHAERHARRHDRAPAGRRACGCSRRPRAATPIISDRWARHRTLLEPGREILLARDGDRRAAPAARAARTTSAAPSANARARASSPSTPPRTAPPSSSATSRRCSGVPLFPFPPRSSCHERSETNHQSR